ncbi:LPS export ABC transporter periplasmic protein LptC [bacterium]|nr:LPS export ABC transporter periplasmic protein LptC [bacterium]
MKKRWLLICIVILTFCSKEEQKDAKEIELPSQIVDNIKMEESSTGKKRYYLEGKRAFYYDKSSKIVVLEPNITFLGPDKEPTSEVTCDSGVVNNRTGDLFAYGHVIVVTNDSTVLRTDSLAWLNRKALIETDAEVLIISKDGEVRGKGLISDADLAKIEIKEKIEGSTDYNIEGENP